MLQNFKGRKRKLPLLLDAGVDTSFFEKRGANLPSGRGFILATAIERFKLSPCTSCHAI
jgi:hypothetical protein